MLITVFSTRIQLIQIGLESNSFSFFSSWFVKDTREFQQNDTFTIIFKRKMKYETYIIRFICCIYIEIHLLI